MTASSVPTSTPVFSIVVTVLDGGDVLRRFLHALTHQENAPTMEILVPYDESIPETGQLRLEFPQATFIEMGKVSTIRPITNAAGQHELYDRRRAAGLAVARGEFISILEDRAPPRANWVSTALRLHRELPHGVIGGAIECASLDLLNWAVYVCDFSRYALPFESGSRLWISDVNVSYKRKMIDNTRHVWHERFNEALVHWALLEQGETLYLSSELIVDYKTMHKSLFRLIPERFHWGRLFGGARAKKLSPLARPAYVLLGPLIPVLLFFRHARTQSQRGNFTRFLKASPFVAALLVGWTAGEAWGYITKKP